MEKLPSKKPVLGSIKIGVYRAPLKSLCQENRVGYRALESLPARWLTEIAEIPAFLHRCAVLTLRLSPTSLICPQVCPLQPRPIRPPTLTHPQQQAPSCGTTIRLILFRLLSHSGTDRVAHQQQELISHSFDGWEVQDQGANTFAVSWDPLPGLQITSSHCALT